MATYPSDSEWGDGSEDGEENQLWLGDEDEDDDEENYREDD